MMSADHNTLDALRRLAKDRAVTPAEKATARRLPRRCLPRSASVLVAACALPPVGIKAVEASLQTYAPQALGIALAGETHERWR
jgi:hypothetical protein